MIVNNKKISLFNIMSTIVIGIASIMMVFPFLWMLSSSLKPELDVFEFPFRLIPKEFRLQNYVELFKVIDFGLYYFNTIKITAITTVLQIITSSLAAYAFSKINFPERDKIFFAYLGTLIVPFQIVMIPQFVLMKNINVEGHLAIILISAFNPFGVFLMRQFFLTIPEELSQAARIDGLNEFGIYARIVMPLSKTAIASLVIYSFVNVWNQFLEALIFVNKQRESTIQLAMRMFMTQYSTEYALIMAASVCAIIPVVVVFLFSQKHFINSITNVGIKG